MPEKDTARQPQRIPQLECDAEEREMIQQCQGCFHDGLHRNHLDAQLCDPRSDLHGGSGAHVSRAPSPCASAAGERVGA